MVFTDPPYLGPAPLHLAQRVKALGDRIVFGSDFPTIPHQFAAQVSGLASLGFGDEWLRKVLWSNGLRLFGLEATGPRSLVLAEPGDSALQRFRVPER